MATYWVGTGNWNSSNTSNWSTSSGGPTGAPVPTIIDDVVFDSNSGNCTIQPVGYGITDPLSFLPAASLNCSLYSGTLTFDNIDNWYTSGLTLAGNLTLSSAMTVAYTNSTNGYTGVIAGSNAVIGFVSSATITTGGKRLGQVHVYGNLTLASDISCYSLGIGGSINTATHNITCGGIDASGFVHGQIIIISDAIITGSRIEVGAWAMNGTSLSATGSTIISYGVFVTAPGPLTYGTVQLSMDDQLNPLVLTGFNATTLRLQVASSSNQFRRTADVVSFSGIFTFTNFICTGLNDGRRVLLKGPATISTSNPTISNVDFMAITGSGITGTRLGNCFRNSGISFESPVTCIPVHSGAYEVSGNWNTRVPLPQDTINFVGSSYILSLTDAMSIRVGSVLGNTYGSNLSRPGNVFGNPATYIEVFPGSSPTTLDFVSGTIVPAVVNVYCDYGPPTLNIHSYGDLNLTAVFDGTLSNDGNLSAYYGSVSFPGTFNTGIVIGPSSSSTSTNSVFGGSWDPGNNNISYPYGTVSVQNGTFYNNNNASVYALHISNANILNQSTTTNFAIGTFTGGGSITFTGTLTINHVDSLANATITGGNLVYAGTGIVTASNMTLSNSHASPAATWYAVTSHDGGGNTGWIFSTPGAIDTFFFGSNH